LGLDSDVLTGGWLQPQMERLNYSGVKFLRNGLPPGEKEESKIPKSMSERRHVCSCC
jgi:hypothetical protein